MLSRVPARPEAVDCHATLRLGILNPLVTV